MATSNLLAGTIMNGAAALMNDPARSVYTYAAQIPYLNLALQELEEEFQLNAVSTTEKTSAVIQVDDGETEIIFNGVGVPSLPDDMIEPQQLWERNRDINPFISMTKREYLPHYLEGVETGQLGIYVWQDQTIKFLPSNMDNDVKIDYIKQLFTPVTDENSTLNIINAKTFLQYRTAGLLAEFIERNQTSADKLNTYAILAGGRALGINVKGKQNIMTRRRPFRAGYKGRNNHG